MKFPIVALISFLLPLGALAGTDEQSFGDAVVSQITSIYDGDTFRCNIAGYPPIIGYHVSVRIAGIDTPELRDKRPEFKELALRAKQFVVQKLRDGKVIELTGMRRDKYFRFLLRCGLMGKLGAGIA